MTPSRALNPLNPRYGVSQARHRRPVLLTDQERDEALLARLRTAYADGLAAGTHGRSHTHLPLATGAETLEWARGWRNGQAKRNATHAVIEAKRREVEQAAALVRERILRAEKL